jgi:hypothetical protein
VAQPLQIDLASYRQLWLRNQLAAPVTVTWTNNRTVMLSVKRHVSAGYRVRLHRMFCQAPDSVWHALLVYIRDPNAVAQRAIRAYINRHRHLICRPPQPEERSRALQPQGHYFDLDSIFRALNQTYFANRVEARITWSRQAPKGPRTSIRFGSYQARDKLIRIHRALDQPFVPRYVIENVVFHEMLHQVIPRQRVNGRWSVHPPEFRRQEQRYPQHRQAEQWQRRHLYRLLHS